MPAPIGRMRVFLSKKLYLQGISKPLIYRNEKDGLFLPYRLGFIFPVQPFQKRIILSGPTCYTVSLL